MGELHKQFWLHSSSGMALLCNLEIVTKIHKEMLHSDLSAQLSHSMNNPKIKEHLNHSGHDCTQAYQLPYGKWKHN